MRIFKFHFKYAVASLSCGKDSVAMVLRLIEEGWPLTHVIFFDTGMEFSCIYDVLEEVKRRLPKNVSLVVLKPPRPFLEEMLLKPVNRHDGTVGYGCDWCGGKCRWMTGYKVKGINDFLKSLDGPYIQYVGIAADEAHRAKEEQNKVYPLIDWGMTEQECLDYCYSKGINWLENGVNLYKGVSGLKLFRVSCFCCSNKRYMEIYFMYKYLPQYFSRLKALQSRIARPFYHGRTVFELEEEFKDLDRQPRQMSMFEFFELQEG